MMSETFVEIPVKVRPRLPKGRLQKMLITRDHVEFKTWANIYGNSISETLLTIPHTNILDVKFNKPRSPSIEGKCQLSYKDKSINPRNLKISATKPNGHFNNAFTETIAIALEELRWQRDILPDEPLIITLKPPSSMLKFFAGLSLFAGAMLVGGFSLGIGYVIFLGLFLFFPSLIAIGIDYVRLHTGWPMFLKILAYIIIFLVGFFLMAFTFTVIDLREII